MDEERILTKTEIVGLGDLQKAFLSLRIGEKIPKLEIKEIRKIINSSKADNLPGVDYKYIIESKDDRILKVNSWVLWKKIAACLQDAGKIESTISLKHTGYDNYTIELLE